MFLSVACETIFPRWEVRAELFSPLYMCDLGSIVPETKSKTKQKKKQNKTKQKKKKQEEKKGVPFDNTERCLAFRFATRGTFVLC